jgi:excinuclease ABC subunit A
MCSVPVYKISFLLSLLSRTTEIYDYLRLVFARIGRTFSPISGKEVKCHSANDVMAYILEGGADTIFILADIDWDQRQDKVELMLHLKEEGYSRFFGEDVIRIEDVMKMAEKGNYPQGLNLLVDRLKLPLFKDNLPYMEDGSPMPQNDWEDLQTRLHSSIASAFAEGSGTMYVRKGGQQMKQFINRFELDGMTFKEPDEYMFSFNSPLGACPACGGLGKIIGISEDLVVPDKTKSIYDGTIACWRGEKMGWFKDQVIKNAKRYGIPIFEPYCNLSEEVKHILWEGRKADNEDDSIIGLNEFFKWVESNRYKIQYKYMLSRFSGRTTCHECKGSRLRKDALYVKVGGKNIHELLTMNVDQLLDFFNNLQLTEYEHSIVAKAIEEIESRLKYIQEVGLSYLSLDRTSNTLSGGESQRINLVTALGSSLVGSMYILDEPSIGLHPRDTERLISVIKRLRDIGNTVVVVEHDEEIIRSADILIDMGPKAGIDGGEVIFQGKINDNIPASIVDRSLTIQYLQGIRKRYVRKKRNWNYFITVPLTWATTIPIAGIFS